MRRGFLIDIDGNIHHTFGDGGRYTPLHGQMQTNLLALIDDRLKPAVQTTLLRARRSEETERSGYFELEVDGVRERLRVEVQAMPPDYNGRRLYLLQLLPEETMPARVDTLLESEQSDQATVDEVAWLRQELVIARQSLESLMQEVGTRNEELQAANEELTAANEELQSTNEELQSVNEELYTVNNEYQKKISELQATTDDLNNVIQSTEIGVLFTDRQRNIRRFTPKATQFLRLIESDVGRPLKDVSPRLPIPDLDGLAKGVVQNASTHEQEVKAEDGQWYLLRVLPYRDNNKNVDGVVLAFVDIHQQKMAELAARIAEERYEMAVAQSGLGIWDWQVQTGELFWSEEFKAMLRVDPYRFDGKFEDFKKRVHPDDAERVEKAIAAHFEKGEPYSLEFRMKRDDGTDVLIHSRGGAIRGDDNAVIRLVGFADDVSERKRQEKALRYEHTPVMIHSIDTEGRLIDVNPFWLKRLGYERDEVIGKPSTDFLTEESRKRAVEQYLPAFFETGHCENLPYQLVARSGEVVDVLLSASSVRDAAGEVVASVATLVDATALSDGQLAQLGLLESIDDLPVAIGIFDIHNRLVRWNRAYADFYAPIEDKLVAGASFAELLEATAAAGIYVDEISIEDEVDVRLGGERWSIERTLTAGGKVRVLDHRMIDGSLAAFRYKIQ